MLPWFAPLPRPGFECTGGGGAGEALILAAHRHESWLRLLSCCSHEEMSDASVGTCRGILQSLEISTDLYAGWMSGMARNP